MSTEDQEETQEPKDEPLRFRSEEEKLFWVQTLQAILGSGVPVPLWDALAATDRAVDALRERAQPATDRAVDALRERAQSAEEKQMGFTMKLAPFVYGSQETATSLAKKVEEAAAGHVDKIGAIKALRTTTGLQLKDAKALIEIYDAHFGVESRELVPVTEMAEKVRWR